MDNKKHEIGQGFVIVALMLIALIAILALTLDGGLTYFQRRRAQNAADAGALAGARAMCTTGGGDPVVAARDYASRNGIGNVNTNVVVSAAQVGVVRSVVVSVTVPYETFFAGVLGIPTTQVGAVAEAACYPPCSGTGLLPVAWSCSPPVNGSVSGLCDVQTPHTGGSCQWGVDPVYIVVDSATIEDDISCAPPVPGNCSYFDPSKTDCDFDNDCILDVHVLSGGSRAWLDLDGGGGGASDLVKWVNGGYNGTPLTPHTWFPGQTGVDTSVYQAMENREGDYVTIPVFDVFHKGLNPPQLHGGSPLDKIISTTASSADYFHVMTFATFYLTCVDAPGTANVPCPAKEWMVDEGLIKANVKTVEGCFVQGLFEGEGLPGECNIDAGAYVLKLIR